MKYFSIFFSLILFEPSIALSDDGWAKLVKSTSGTDAKKPASLVYTSDSGTAASYDLNAAIISNELSLIPKDKRNNIFSMSVAVTAGIAKNTLSKSITDTRSVGLTTYLDYNTLESGGAGYEIPASLFLGLDDNLIKNDKSTRLDLEVPIVRTKWILPLSTLGFPSGNIRFVPIVGAYQRHITSTQDATAAPLGNIGGPHVALQAVATLGQIRSDGKWFERIGIDILIRRVDSTWTSRGYSKSVDYFRQGTLSFNLADTPKGGWQPSIALTRTKGVDQLSDTPYKDETSLALLVGYGI